MTPRPALRSTGRRAPHATPVPEVPTGLDHMRDERPKRRSAGSTGGSETVAAIKDLMLARQLHPGDPMPTELELVEELGVSRTSVREAVRTLVALDILEVRHGFGTFVGQLSLRPFVESVVFRGALIPGADYERLAEVVEVRQGLDLELAPTILAGIAGADTTQLREHVDSMERSALRGEAFTADDRAFHMLLASLVPNGLYSQLVSAFWMIHMQIAPGLPVIPQDEVLDSARSHRALLDAAVVGDLDGYREAVVRHYDHIRRAQPGSSAR